MRQVIPTPCKIPSPIGTNTEFGDCSKLKPDINAVEASARTFAVLNGILGYAHNGRSIPFACFSPDKRVFANICQYMAMVSACRLDFLENIS
jgi:hypothetical protein